MKPNTIFLPEAIIDTHCHGRDLKQKHKTTVEQTLREARKGNIGITVFMPNTDPPITDIHTLIFYMHLADKAQTTLGLENRQYVYFGVTDDNLDICASALDINGVVGLKIYPVGVTTGGSKIGVCNTDTIEKVLEIASFYNKVVAVHCDDPEIIAKEGHTIRAEVSYLKKVISLIRKVPQAKVLICHVSCRESAEIILRAQQEGLKVALEICPHYLWFDDEKTNWNNDLDPIFYHCYNKLRSVSDRHYLTSLIRDNNPLMFIGSDNAQHTPTEKLLNKLGGFPTNQEMVAVIITLALRMKLPEKQMGNLLCYNAANFLGIPVSSKKMNTG